MALALCLQTRVDLAIYIVALRRYARSPTAEHFRELNAIMLWATKRPLKNMYYFMKCDRKLQADPDALREGIAESDRGFSGRAVKGVVCVRWGTRIEGVRCVHVLDQLQGQRKQVSRATFTSEALACINAVDQRTSWLSYCTKCPRVQSHSTKPSR